MKYCVVKGTTKIIDGSENPIEIMLQNAHNAGFEESEIEILTEEEYLEKIEPMPIIPSQVERIEALEMAVLEMILAKGDA